MFYLQFHIKMPQIYLEKPIVVNILDFMQPIGRHAIMMNSFDRFMK